MTVAVPTLDLDRPAGHPAPLIDPFARAITYLRVSVTDRCDFRCVYCMAEDMTFLPKKDVLSLEELDRLCSAFVTRGVRKLRLTGGEPLVRRELPEIVRRLAALKPQGLDDLSITTNGYLLERSVGALAAAGLRRLNVSVDSLVREEFARITRRDALSQVLAGLRAFPVFAPFEALDFRLDADLGEIGLH